MQLSDAKPSVKKSEWDMLGQELGNTQPEQDSPTQNVWKYSMDDNVIDAYGKLCNIWLDEMTESMNVYVSYAKLQTDMVIDALKVGNNIFNSWIDMYGKIVTFWTPKSS